ncbi:MAG: dihydroorotase [Acidobacteriota bacterium]
MNRLIRGGRVVDPSQDLDQKADVLITAGRIAAIEPAIEIPEDCELIDAEGHVVTPGWIDAEVHLREPGEEHRETVATGLRAAARGGFTTVLATPDTDPVLDCRSVCEHLHSLAAAVPDARLALLGAVSKGLAGEELAAMGEVSAAGAVGFFEPRTLANTALLRRALEYARHFDAPVAVCNEDPHLVSGGVMHEGEVSTRLGLPGRPALAEESYLARDLMLAADTGGRLHIARITTAAGLEMVREARRRGVQVTCATTVQHLVLTDEEVAARQFSPLVKVKPPLRPETDRRALVAALAAGEIDIVVSGHEPSHDDEVLVPFSAAPFGVSALETAAAVCLDRLVHTGGVPLAALIAAFTSGPARLYGLEAGTLAPGSPAHITLLDEDRDTLVDPTMFASRGRNNPYAGQSLRGGVVGTLVAGQPMMAGEPVDPV